MDRKIEPSGRQRQFSAVLILLTCFSLTFSSLAAAQLSTGNISGTVTDQTGGVTPGAAVTIKNLETGVTRSVVANESGRYSG